MPVIIRHPKNRTGAGQLASAAVAKTAVGRDEAHQHLNPAVSDPNPDQRAISAARIRAELSRHKNHRASQRELKSKRRELRLTPSMDDLIRCAMEVSGVTAGDLAYQGALNLLQRHYLALRMRRQRDRNRR